MSTESRLGVVFTMGVFTVSALDPPSLVVLDSPRQRGRMVIGGRKMKKADPGGMESAFVELMVIETTTSSMRTKRSTN